MSESEQITDKKSQEKVETIYQRILDQHPELEKINKKEICEAITLGLNEINKLENLAYPENINVQLSKKIVSNITVLWDFSGPGVYSGPDRDDRYKDIKWTRSMERDRLNYTFNLFKEIKKTLKNNLNIFSKKTEPIILYNGTIDENNRLRNAIEKGEIDVPKEKFLIIDNENIHSTNDQIKNIIWPEILKKPGKEIGLISHAPHLWRIVHVINHYKNIPKDMTIRLFPVPTPIEGKEEYAIMEIMGLIYYAYNENEKTASKEACPYIIQGEK